MRDFLALALVAASISVSQADEDTVSTEDKAAAVHEWADTVAASLRMYADKEEQPCELCSASLLQWTNPIAGEVFGDCYLWTHQNRPVAFMSIYAFYKPETKRRVTLQSLSETKVRAVFNDISVWEPTTAGLIWADTETLPAPASRSIVRRRQMRGIAAQYSARIEHKDEPETFRDLRLLTQPLYRYSCPKQKIPEGALFAYVEGTDPELLLMIEYTESPTRKFRMAPIRQNHRRLRLDHDDIPIWNVPALAPPFPNPKISSPSGIYYNTEWQRIEESRP